MLDRFKQNLINMPGWRTTRKIIVFESDDWGSMRMPNIKALEDLTIKGIRVDNKDHWRLDCLENKTDLENLFSIISGFKDKHNKHPIFTFNTVMGNPDFYKIRISDYNQFFNEHFFDSYKKYHNQNLKDLWLDAIRTGLIMPQFHAREHVNVPLWMHDLKTGLQETRMAFDHNFFGLVTRTSSANQKHYLAAYRAESEDQLQSIKNSLCEGLDMFEKTFGFKSKSFIACNYIWPMELESVLKEKKVSFIQGQRGRFRPNPFNHGKGKIVRNYIGEKTILGLTHTIRNVKFEPFESPVEDSVGKTIKEIQNAFFWKKPAIISTHRINYVGGIDVSHRDRNLKSLELLLQSILNRWPEVEFLSSDQLGDLIEKSNI